MNLVWKYNDLTLKSKLNFVYFDLSFLENKYKTSSKSLRFIYMHLISISCDAVLVTETIFRLVFLTASQFWHHLLDKIFWQNKMLFRPTIPSFFSAWNLKQTYIFLAFSSKCKKKVTKTNLRIIYKPHVHLQIMQKHLESFKKIGKKL